MRSLLPQNQAAIEEIGRLHTKLMQGYSMEEIAQMFYNNLLLHLSTNRDRHLRREEMLQALTTPLIPVPISVDKLREENKALKDLVGEYVLMYGHKTLQGKPLEIPYQYLVRENQVMYKMLMTLLPGIQYDKNHVNRLRESL